MEKSKNIVAMAKSPAKDAHHRNGKGFSLLEIKEAGKSVELLKELNINIDFFRKSKHEANIELLKKVKPVSKKVKKKKPYEFKEKKKTPFKPKVEKPKKKPTKVEKTPAKPKAVKKTPAPKKEKVKKGPKPAKKEVSTAETTKLTSLSGLGPATAKKFEQLGVSCVEELVNEDPAELATLIKGISEERIINWINECKELLNN
ncbi:MAG: helix-hairpin-helix domain-containing protein [Promethearchaeota archaeon]|jgi:predicted flap endonuclease-1-like 5' DNA nuclease